MTQITYFSLLELGFIDPANNGWGCRINIDKHHEICWYRQDKTVKYQTRCDYTGNKPFTRTLNCINLSDVEFAYRLFTGKHLVYRKLFENTMSTNITP